MMQQIALATVMVATSLAAAFAALLGMHGFLRYRAGQAARREATRPAADEDAVLLFDDEALVDASETARSLLAALPPGTSEWARFAAWASARFPAFAAQMAGLCEVGRLRLESATAQPIVLKAEWLDGLARISLLDPRAEGRTVPVERLSLAATEEELTQLRRIIDAAPLPVWRETDAGEVVWANQSYLQRAADAAGVAPLTWPLPRLFEIPRPASAATRPARVSGAAPPSDDVGEDAPQPGADPGRSSPAAGPSLRRALDRGPDGGRLSFDCFTADDREGGRLCYALPADAAERAEAALADLVQTLSRTFAHLPVGLAVFDRKRRLQLFNPALTDLTTLPPEFLSARPGFEQFFDALRARQMIPEPKDYRAWRHGLTGIERAAASGHYQEIWSLTTGQTYRVTGRPHADGAVAFLIEDVSAEVSLTRRFRAEIETGQAVIDSLVEAIAVFSPAGVLVMANAAYAEMWGTDPETGLGETGVAEALRLWKAMAHPSPHWAELRTLIGAGGPRRNWEGMIQLRDGRHTLCRLTPLAAGATLVGFRPAVSGGATPVPVMTDEPAGAPASDGKADRAAPITARAVGGPAG